MSNPQINEWYDLAMANGALGGKLIGAGGGGFLMFYANDKATLRHAMRGAGVAGGAFPLRLRGHEDRRSEQFADVIKSRRSGSTEPLLANWTGCAAGGRVGDAAAAHHGDDSQDARAGGGRAVPRAPTPPVASARVPARRCCASGTSASGSSEEFGDGGGVRVPAANTRSTARTCSAPAGRSSGRCPCWASAFVVLYGDSYLPMDYAAAVAAFEAAASRG